MAANQIPVCLVGSAAFLMLARKKDVHVFAASMQDIEKALSQKEPVDPRTTVLEEYHDLLDMFSEVAADLLLPRQDCDMKIDLLPGCQLPAGLLYSMSQGELVVLKKFIDNNLRKGFIQSSKSLAVAPVLFAKKPGSGLRLCVDYHSLNKVMVKNKYPMPLIQETLDCISKARFFTVLDIQAAFHKLRVTEGDEWKTAMKT